MLQPILDRLFDRILVVSLPASADRRAHVRRHFAGIGITRWAFFDATPADHPAVATAYSTRSVARFPPCFRCGKTTCGKPDCNNVSIPAQVANVLTYRRLWAEIAGLPKRTLVLEDDVVFMPWAQEVLAAVDPGTAMPAPNVPRLLRLGWAEGADHRAPASGMAPRLASDVRMSNPAHAMTPAFAKAALLRTGTNIDTTSDLTLHLRIPRVDEARTLFPPVATELSWSRGALPSLIHPKRIRSDFLRAVGDSEAAAENDRAVSDHIAHMEHRRFLLIGHPRCGTGFAAGLFRQCGLDIGHEADGADGLSSWMFAGVGLAPYAQSPVARTRRALVWEYLVQPVRDPATAIPSIIRDTRHAPPSYDYRRREILTAVGIDLDHAASEVDAAVLSLTAWDDMIAALGPALSFRIEDQAASVVSFLARLGVSGLPDPDSLDLTPRNSNKPYRGVRYPKPNVTAADWIKLPARSQARLRAYCLRHGYVQPAGLDTGSGS